MPKTGNRLVAPLLGVLALLTVSSCVGESNTVTYVTGAINAEDLVPLPGGKWIVTSGLDGPGTHGRLSLIDVEKKTARLLFSGDSPVSADKPEGDPKCPGPLTPGKFGAHGLGLRATGPKAGTLYVVNHTGREAVELFVLNWAGDSPTAVWTGCIPLPAGVLSNGVAPLPDGRIAVTHMNAPEYFGGKPAGRENMAAWIPKFIAGETTGYAATWGIKEGWKKVPGSEGSVPNGIEAAPDGSAVYLVLWGNQELRRVSLNGGAVQSVKLDFMPDNLRWGDNGKLWTAGAVGDRKAYFACAAKKDCHNDYRLAVLDPVTMKAKVVPHPDTRPTFSHGTTAVKVGGFVWIGSNPTERVAVLPLKD